MSFNYDGVEGDDCLNFPLACFFILLPDNMTAAGICLLFCEEMSFLLLNMISTAGVGVVAAPRRAGRYQQ